MTLHDIALRRHHHSKTDDNALTTSVQRQVLLKNWNGLIDIVIPVYNEQQALPRCIATLDEYLEKHCPWRFQITIVDNGSQDATWPVAQQLVKQYKAVTAVHLDQKGRGRALKHAWLRSLADIMAYMDVDLSTDLADFMPLIEPLVSGQAQLATGSRLLLKSRVRRSLKREFISRSYNYLLRWRLGLQTRDAQCGFKAITATAAKKLLPKVKDNAWFFDSELLVRAERAGMTVHERAVGWREDADSRVNIKQTALDDLRGIRRLRKEFAGRGRAEKLVLGGILLSSGLLYGYGALQNGYANSFYAAAVQAGTVSWKAFLFGSLDGSNFITVDKPPAALWFMEISTRIFGFHAWSMLLPEVLAGVATIYLVYAAVRRWFSATSALLAAAIMALTPVAALMFGYNNPDALLTLLLTASVYTLIRALESSRPVFWLSLTAVATGFAFNTKMLQGLIVLPILALVYLLAARPSLLQRIKQLLIAGIVLVVAALWWPLTVSLMPAASRPYIGSSSNNSIWNLIEGYNGVGRLLGLGSGQGGGPGGGRAGGSRPNGVAVVGGTTGMPAGQPTGGGRGGIRGGGGPGGSGFGGSTGALRMFNSDFGPNIAWFIPLGVGVTALALWQRRRAQRTDKLRAAFLLWGGYAALHIVVFSMVSGVIHPYYPLVMAPALAALVGMGLPRLLGDYRRGGKAAGMLPVLVAATAITATIILSYQTSFLPWLRWVVLLGGLASALLLLLHLVEPLARRMLRLCLIAAAAACLIAPTIYAVDTALQRHTGSIPTAGPGATGMQGSNNESASAEQALVQYLLQHQGTARWVAAVNSANESAAIQISSGQPVMAIGGFNGSDNALDLAELKKLVSSGQLRYYVTRQGGTGRSQSNSQLTSWLTAHKTITYGGSQYTVYDLTEAS